MRFATPEGNIRTTQDLIVLQLANANIPDPRALRRVLIPLPGSYDDLVAAATQTFDLPLDVSMRVYTQELAGNIGWNVEITKIVWDAVRSILTLVIVEPKGATPEARKTPRKSIAPPQPDRVVTHDAGAAPTKEVLEAARRLSRLSLAPAPRRSLAPRASLAPSSRTDGAGSVRDGGGDALEGEDEEEDIVFRSGRGVGKRQVIASEDEDEDKEDEDAEDENAEDEDAEDEDEDEDEHEHSDDDMIDDDAIEDDLRDELEEHMEEADEDAGEDPFLSAQGSRAEREPSPAPEQPPPRTPASQAARRTSEQRSRVSQAAPSPKFKPEGEAARSPAPKVKQEKVHETPSRAAPPRTQTQPEDRFVIIIEYDDGAGAGEETQTMFKTRGRHTVAKVLMQACRTFGIEDLYDKSQLVLALELEEGGEIVEHRFMCPKEETMAQVGAESESRFIVQVEDE
ncbi:hypothetical protein FOMPIDRAFT_82520 [Fomitopsis schrenkii]|uniref:Uncharacterized protein n=1 Tax=Fomitopsis schrenkii TaxID=2126942 RepID=S8EC18_FOMSC|nr:hypothetical protein FOMPIDRAFT_82520 [Fomitopsis schrenkii]